MSENLSPTAERRAPRVVVIGLASCFGCQINITNIERHLMDVLGQIDLGYWQLTSSVPMPDEFDVAVIEGAVTTDEAAETVRRARERAGSVIAIGSCAVTGGIPGMASGDLAGHVEAVYGDAAPDACGDLLAPRPVSDVIDVDAEVRCCPIDGCWTPPSTGATGCRPPRLCVASAPATRRGASTSRASCAWDS